MKTNTSSQIISDFNKFKKQTRAEFNREWKVQKLVYEISVTLFLISLLGLIFNWGSDSEIGGYFVVLILPATMGSFYAFSYGLSAGELRKAFRRRKRNLIKAHKAAQKSEDFYQFLNKIKIK
ncbi:MAG TPA: hypothetical protein PKV88_00145 [Bacteroidales bacterium]|nr:hypothetical protein [Bacteroidales bacterium]